MPVASHVYNSAFVDKKQGVSGYQRRRDPFVYRGVPGFGNGRPGEIHENRNQQHPSSSPQCDSFARIAQTPPVASLAEPVEQFLRKPAIEKFDGDPLDYWAFVNRLKIHLAERRYKATI